MPMPPNALDADSFNVEPPVASWFSQVLVDGLDPSRVLFVGLGQTAVAWYRCILPALFLNADWVGLAGEPPRLMFLTGLVKGQTRMADLRNYDTIVLQQPRGRAWLKLIRELQRAGKKIIFEIDDYLHAIRNMPDHDYHKYFDKKALAEIELCMRACDAVVASTDYIARRYRSFNEHVYVCENGLDMGRYALTLPSRPTVQIGWAGATGHIEAVRPWLQAVYNVMTRHPNTTFVSIGQPFADALADHFPGRTLAVPFTLVDTYPAAMTLFDIAIAPAGRNNFAKGKSDLRWVEASALGIPIVADPDVYHHIEDGVTGLHARTAAEAEEKLELLVTDAELRTAIGSAAKVEVRRSRDMRVAVKAWAELLITV